MPNLLSPGRRTTTVLIVSGAMSILTFLLIPLLERSHSNLLDFTRTVCLPVFCCVFILLLFTARTRRTGISAGARKCIRGLRLAVLAALAVSVVFVCWPRSYGSAPMVSRVDTRYWDLPTGSHIAYNLVQAKGVRHAYPILFLQGGPGGCISDGLIQTIGRFSEDGYDVYLYDQIGSGWSDRLSEIREYTADRHKRDLEAIIRQIGAQKVILIGQSWGAILATLFTADNPGLVDRMILTGPGPIIPVHPELTRVKAPDSLHLRAPYYSNRQGNDRVGNARTRLMTTMATQFGVKLASDEEADDFAAWWSSNVNWSTVCDTSLIRKDRWRKGDGFYAQVMTVASFPHTVDPRPRLHNTVVPILVMKGQCDNQPWGFTHEYLDLFPRHEMAVIPDAGHGIFGEQPELYYWTIRRFLLH